MDYQEDYIEVSMGGDRTIQDVRRQAGTDEVGGVEGTYKDDMDYQDDYIEVSRVVEGEGREETGLYRMGREKMGLMR